MAGMLPSPVVPAWHSGPWLPSPARERGIKKLPAVSGFRRSPSGTTLTRHVEVQETKSKLSLYSESYPVLRRWWGHVLEAEPMITPEPP